MMMKMMMMMMMIVVDPEMLVLGISKVDVAHQIRPLIRVPSLVATTLAGQYSWQGVATVQHHTKNTALS